MKVKMTEEQKEIIGAMREKLETSWLLFESAGILHAEAEKKFWAAIRKEWPGAIKVLHPTEGDWEVILGFPKEETDGT